MSEENQKMLLIEIIRQVIEEEKENMNGVEKKENVKSKIYQKIKNHDTYTQGQEMTTPEALESILCHLIDLVVLTLNTAFGKNWIMSIISKMF